VATLTGTPSTVDLGQGYGIRAPGVTGSAVLQQPNSQQSRSRSRADTDGTADLDLAFAATEVTEVKQIDLKTQTGPRAAAGAPLRSVDGQEDELELQVPDAGEEWGQLVLVCDEAGGLSWHLPLNDELQVEPQRSRGAGGVKRFRIPATPRPPSTPEGARSRSLLGVAGRKLLKVLVYPITDPIVGFVGDKIAARWEAGHRPYGLRAFGPADFRQPSTTPLSPEDWKRLSSGRALLFIHGTFSTAHGAFGQMDDATFASLHQHYGGRVLAFNHFTLSEDPKQNIQWLLKNVPAGLAMNCDIICHSRGGLVARVLAEQRVASASPFTIGRVVFVGVPNQGTALAHPDHMVQMIDRLTTAVNVLPTGFVTEILEGLITAVKTIGHGALKGLDGLRSMQPGGDFLKWLNVPIQQKLEYFGISSNYEPTDEGLRAMVRNLAVNKLLDTIFESAGNDLVVPEAGVHAGNGSSLFPLEPARLLTIASDAGVSHVTFFSYPATNQTMAQWLTS
jgi:hypothetical protein